MFKQRTNRLVLAILFVTMLLVGGHIVSLYFAAQRADRNADRHNAQLVQKFIATYQDNLIENMERYAVSGSAFKAVLQRGESGYFGDLCTNNRFKSEFVTFGIIAADRQRTFLCSYGEIKQPDQHGYVFDTVSEKAAKLIAGVERVQQEYGVAVPEYTFATDTVAIDRHVFLAIVAIIAPARQIKLAGNGRTAAVFSTVNLEKTILRHLPETLSLSGFQVTAGKPREVDRHVTPLMGRDGETVAYLSWNRSSDFSTLLVRVLPGIAGFSALLLACLIVFLAKITRLQQLLVGKEQEARHLAMHDPLTGLPNRAAFNDRVESAIAGAVAGRRCYVGLVDLDHFKQVNDSFGHDMGDALIIETGQRIKAVLGPESHVARLGGDEFAFVLPADGAIGDPADAGVQLNAVLRRPFEFAGHRVMPSASIGIATCPDHGRSAAAILKSADIALYASKNQGRGCYNLFEGSRRPATPPAALRAS